MTRTQTKVMTADFKGSYNALPEGRQWTVHSTSGNDYVVTIWTDPARRRMALCSCKASEFDLACRHIRFAQMADSYLTNEPVREILPVYADADCPTCEGQHNSAARCVALPSAEAEDRMMRA